MRRTITLLVIALVVGLAFSGTAAASDGQAPDCSKGHWNPAQYDKLYPHSDDCADVVSGTSAGAVDEGETMDSPATSG